MKRQQIALSHSFDVELSKIEEQFSLLVNDTTLLSFNYGL